MFRCSLEIDNPQSKKQFILNYYNNHHSLNEYNKTLVDRINVFGESLKEIMKNNPDSVSAFLWDGIVVNISESLKLTKEELDHLSRSPTAHADMVKLYWIALQEIPGIQILTKWGFQMNQVLALNESDLQSCLEGIMFFVKKGISNQDVLLNINEFSFEDKRHFFIKSQQLIGLLNDFESFNDMMHHLKSMTPPLFSDKLKAMQDAIEEAGTPSENDSNHSIEQCSETSSQNQENGPEQWPSVSEFTLE